MFSDISKELYDLNVFSDPDSSWPFPVGLASDLIAKNMSDDVISYILSKTNFSFFEAYDLFLILLNRDFKSEKKQLALKKLHTFIGAELEREYENPKVIGKYLGDYGAIIFLLNSLSEIELPIYRRCVSKLSLDSKSILREYKLSFGAVKLIAELDQAPKLGYFKHTLEPEKVKKYDLYLSEKDIAPEKIKKMLIDAILIKQSIKQKTNSDMQLYFINEFRSYLGLKPMEKLKIYLNKQNYLFSKEQKEYFLKNKQGFLKSTEKIIREMVGE